MKFIFLISILFSIFHLQNATTLISRKKVFSRMNDLKFNVTLVTRELNNISEKVSAFTMARLIKYKRETVRLMHDRANGDLKEIKNRVEVDMKNMTVAQECYEVTDYLMKQRVEKLATDSDCDPIDLEVMHTFVKNVTAVIKYGDDLIEELDNTTISCCSPNIEYVLSCLHKNFANWRNAQKTLKEKRKSMKNLARIMYKKPNHFKCFGNRIAILLVHIKNITAAADECFDQLTIEPLIKLDFHHLDEEPLASVKKHNSSQRPAIT